MKQTETAKLLAVIKTAYPHFEISNEVVRLWHDLLQSVFYETARHNLREHIKSNKWPPLIADIIKVDKEAFANYDKYRLDTVTFLENRRQLRLERRLNPKLLGENPYGR